ncbi:hypothetical protein [Pseudomonas jilinensis]|uniref:Mu-like prophage FluMu N-terminal domain-containing protein n=1 Tax=Pseudomonas jilinensis TaxID=2078689 RepID=A0A396S066_9PSED|nr:hypothetical protein [Pseudomonas jilinensis]RHW21886.1 hypothetical protein C2846_05335 [Pseudomonas jilinensis]
MASKRTTKTDDKSDDFEGLYVRSIPERRCRAGFVFDRDGLGIALDALTAKQVADLEADPLLKVERCSFPVDQDGAAE